MDGVNNISTGQQFVEKPEKNADKDRKLREASKQLESVFIGFVLKAMQKTLHKGPLSDGENNLASMMFSSVMGKEMAEKGGIGLAEHIYRSMSDREEDIDLEELTKRMNSNAYQKYEMLRLNHD